MSVVAVQISVRCAACAAVVPVNAHAPAVACWSCERQTPLDASTWQLLLAEPLRDAATVTANVEQNASIRTGSGTFQRVFRGGEPVCIACRASISTDDLRRLVDAEHPTKLAHCTACGHGILVRMAPPELARAGVVALVGESEEQLAGRARTHEPVPLACTGCGGSLSVDGTSRTVVCVFCGSTQFLPDALWYSLRSTPVYAWSLVLAAGSAPAVANRLAGWSSLYDVVADPEGNLYGVGVEELVFDAAHAAEGKAAAKEALRAEFAEFGAALLKVGGSASVFSMTGDGVLRWERRGLPFGMHARLAWAPPGYVLVWEGGGAEVMQADDGTTAHRFGVDGPPLETTGATTLAIDADGSIVHIAEDQRILRADARGNAIATWGTGQRAAVGTGGDGPWVHQISKQPLRVYKAQLGAGWDRRLWVQSSIAFDDAVHVTSFDRNGARGPVASVRPGFYPKPGRRPVVDAAGNAFVMVHRVEAGLGTTHHVFRIASRADGGTPHLVPQSHGGLLGRLESLLAGLPDGTLFTLGEESRMRRFAPNGAVTFISEAALASDQA